MTPDASGTIVRLRTECQCGDFDHDVRFSLDTDDGDVTVEVRLNVFLPWWTRLWIAVLYAFGRSYGYNHGHYDVTVLRHDDFAALHEVLDQATAIRREKHRKEDERRARHRASDVETPPDIVAAHQEVIRLAATAPTPGPRTKLEQKDGGNHGI